MGVVAEVVEGAERATLIGVGRRELGAAAAGRAGVPQAELDANKGEEEEEESVRINTGPDTDAVESVRESVREGGGNDDEESVRPRGSRLVAMAPAKSNGGTCSNARIQSS